MVRSMTSNATLPKSYWGHTLETAVLTFNMVPSKSVEKDFIRVMIRENPKYVLSLKFGVARFFVKRLTSDKLASKSDKCFFVGYPKETKGYYFYYQYENKRLLLIMVYFGERVSRKRK